MLADGSSPRPSLCEELREEILDGLTELFAPHLDDTPPAGIKGGDAVEGQEGWWQEDGWETHILHCNKI